MEKIKLITDSTSDLPKDLIQKYNIEVLPLIVNIGEESFYDNENITSEELCRKVSEGSHFPKTSQITPQRFIEVFEKYINEGYKILCMNLSSKLSGTVQSAMLAKSEFKDEDIVVIDSMNVAGGFGMLVLEAANQIERGKSLKEIEKNLIEAVPHVKSFIAINTLDHLIKSGRISKVAGSVGTLINIKILLKIEDGVLKVKDKVRGSKKLMKELEKLALEADIDEEKPCTVMSLLKEDAKEKLEEVLDSRGIKYHKTVLGCVVAAHSGPGAAGIFYFEKY